MTSYRNDICVQKTNLIYNVHLRTFTLPIMMSCSIKSVYLINKVEN